MDTLLTCPHLFVHDIDAHGCNCNSSTSVPQCDIGVQARLAFPKHTCIMITYEGSGRGVWKFWRLHMKCSSQVSCHLVVALEILVLTHVLLSGSLGFQSQHLFIRHGTIHTAQSTSSLHLKFGQGVIVPSLCHPPWLLLRTSMWHGIQASRGTL